jgi:hypothetical protein
MLIMDVPTSLLRCGLPRGIRVPECNDVEPTSRRLPSQNIVGASLRAP